MEKSFPDIFQQTWQNNDMLNMPILYSFRRCPYAIRARLALKYASIEYIHREVILKSKPQALLSLSCKATVPVLQLCNGQVLEESLDIMHWALGERDPDDWRQKNADSHNEMQLLTLENDTQFKDNLDHYKYADRHPVFPQEHYLHLCEPFLVKLESRLSQGAYLFGSRLSYADIAISPFIRQFSKVDEQWFCESPYPNLKNWLNEILTSPLFLSVMIKYTPWQSCHNDKVIING